MVSSVSVPVQKLLPPNPLDQLGGCSPVGYPSWKLGTIALRRRTQWQPTPVIFPGKSHGWRSLVGCCPWGHKELDMIERLHFHFSLSCIGEGNGNPLQCSCLENPRDGGAWWAAIYGVTQSRTWLTWLSSNSSSSFKKDGTHFSVFLLASSQNFINFLDHSKDFERCSRINPRFEVQLGLQFQLYQLKPL